MVEEIPQGKEPRATDPSSSTPDPNASTPVTPHGPSTSEKGKALVEVDAEDDEAIDEEDLSQYQLTRRTPGST